MGQGISREFQAASAIVDRVVGPRTPAHDIIESKIAGCALLIVITELSAKDPFYRAIEAEILEIILDIFPDGKSLIVLIDLVDMIQRVEPFVVIESESSFSKTFASIREVIQGYREGACSAIELLYGKLELASRENFNEDGYFSANPDVASAVAAGAFSSGLHHFELMGLREQRRLRVVSLVEEGE